MVTAWGERGQGWQAKPPRIVGGTGSWMVATDGHAGSTGAVPAHTEYRHEALPCSGADQFAAATVPFILDGLRQVNQ